MLQPVTEIGKKFSADCQSLSDALRSSEVGFTAVGKQDRVSRAIQLFFESVQRLPKDIAPLDSKATVLFEIDCALSGLYGTTIFCADEDTHPVRILLRDLAALWQRFHLIAGLERMEASPQALNTTMNFFQSWVGASHNGGKEYERLLHDVALILDNPETLNLPAKVTLFSLMGNILVTLGVSEEFAVGRIESYGDAIKQRRRETTREALPEILLCLQILSTTGRTIESFHADGPALRKAIAHWASNDDFLRQLFTSWGWLMEYDFVSPLVIGDIVHLRQRSTLYESWANGTARMGTGHSFLEYAEHQKENKGLGVVFRPVPIFVFGHAGAGKTSLLTALCYDTQMRMGRTLSVGQEFRAYYETMGKPWRGGGLPPTSGAAQGFTFWSNLDVASFVTYEYGGKETQPDQWERQLQETIRSARGLIFLLDATECASSELLREKATWFGAVLQYWIQANRQIRHVPIAVVVTKCDQLLAEGVQDLRRSSLVPEYFEPGLVDVLLSHRFPGASGGLVSPLDRLRALILHDRDNNAHPAIQDLVDILLENLGQFFTHVISMTYNYQIFLTSALPPRDAGDPVFPWGVHKPFEWMTDVLERFHIRESLAKMREEELALEGRIREIRGYVKQAQECIDQINYHNREITQLATGGSVWGSKSRQDRIKFHNENKAQREQEFVAIMQKYAKESGAVNKQAGMSLLQAEAHGQEELLGELRQRKGFLENLLRSREAQRNESFRGRPAR